MSLRGGWVITEDAEKYPTCSLPEQVATAFSEVTKALLGPKYEPLMYAATQVVSGTNHMILCRQTLSDAERTVKLSTLVLNIPANGEPQIVVINPLF